MFPRTRQVGLLFVLVILAVARPEQARAITVDGVLDAGYTLLSTQTVQTSAANDTQGLIGFGNGSELDALYGAVDNGVLYLFLAGNLKDAVCGREACTESDFLEVFIDSQSGGQNPLVSNSPATLPFAGLTFDSGFAPDYWLEYYDVGALSNVFQRQADWEELPSGGGGASYTLGTGSNAGAPGTLGGGTNPYGIEATIDNRNTVGVDAGCAASSGAGVTTGVELAIPLAAIGNPGGCIRVSALVYSPSNSYSVYQLTQNQVVGPVPAGTCSLGAAASVNFANLAGDQFVSFCFGPTPARSTTWGRLKTIYR